jgi:hypothetical protein
MIWLFAAAAVISAPLQGLIDGLQTRDPVHGKQVADTVQAAPALAGRLGELARTGQLKEIAVVPAGPGRVPFGGAPQNGVIRIRAEILDGSAAYRQQHHVDPLVFFLGYQAAKIASHAELAARLDRAKSLLHAEAGKSVDATPGALAFMQAEAGDDAKAVIAGWNNSFDAALAARSGPPTLQEAAELVRDQPYADLLIGSMKRPDGGLVLPASLSIAATPDNVRAVSDTLLQPPQAPH